VLGRTRRSRTGHLAFQRAFGMVAPFSGCATHPTALRRRRGFARVFWLGAGASCCIDASAPLPCADRLRRWPRGLRLALAKTSNPPSIAGYACAGDAHACDTCAGAKLASRADPGRSHGSRCIRSRAGVLDRGIGDLVRRPERVISSAPCSWGTHSGLRSASAWHVCTRDEQSNR